MIYVIFVINDSQSKKIYFFFYSKKQYVNLFNLPFP